MEFRAIKRRLDDGRHFWGLFSSENDLFQPPLALSARTAAESGCGRAVSDLDAGAIDSSGIEAEKGQPEVQSDGTGGLELEATLSKAKDWQKSGGHARVRACSKGNGDGIAEVTQFLEMLHASFTLAVNNYMSQLISSAASANKYMLTT